MNSLRPWFKLSCVVFILLGHFIWLLVNVYIGRKLHRCIPIRRSFCRSATRALGIEAEFQELSSRPAGLYISNHRSMLDPLIELGYLDTYILSKAEVASYPLIGRGAKETGVLFVDRDRDDSRKAALIAIEKLLLSGQSVLIYPEGTTYGGDLTGDFRKGAFEVAHKHRIPVVPVMIEYPDASYYWTDGSLMDYFKRIFARGGKHRVILQAGSAINAETKEELILNTKMAIDEMIAKARNRRNLTE